MQKDQVNKKQFVNQEEYKNHKIFFELEQYIDFYDSLSLSVFSWVSMGTTALNFDTYLFSSIKNTVESIKIILEHGKINDAYSLARKYHDSTVINIYESLYLKEHFSMENMIVEKINDWLKGKQKLPEYRVMMNYIRNSSKLKTINDLLFQTKEFKELRQRLNDHTHYNYFQYMMLNDSEVYNSRRVQTLDQFSQDIRDIFIKHFIWLFTVNEHYMMSSDHMDYLECGKTPPENSQYWVAKFVHETFNNIVKPYREDLAAELKRSTDMELDK